MQRRQDPNGDVQAAQNIADGIAHPGGRVIGLAGDAHDAAHCLRQDVVSGPLRIGTVAPETRDLGIDELVVDLFEHVVAEPQLIHDAGAVIFDNHIGLADHLFKELFGLRRL